MAFLRRQGFTLIEVILYAAILGIILAVLTGTITLTTRVQVHERASTELANQLNFTTQTIQRLIREASVIIGSNELGSSCTAASDDDAALGSGPFRCLKLRMEDSSRDPVSIWAEPKPGCAGNPCPGVIKIKEGSASQAFTSDVVSCEYSTDIGGHCLTFEKYGAHRGNTIVQVNLALTQRGNPPLTRSIATAVGRVSAASFDSLLIPSSDGNLDLGYSPTPPNPNAARQWRNLYLSGNLYAPNNWDGFNKGYNIIGYSGSGGPITCSAVCGQHGLSCLYKIKLGNVPSSPPPPQNGIAGSLAIGASCTISSAAGDEIGLCLCF